MAILLQKEASAEQILFSCCPKGRRAIVTAILRCVHSTSCDVTALIGTFFDMLLLLQHLFPEVQSQWQRET